MSAMTSNDTGVKTARRAVSENNRVTNPQMNCIDPYDLSPGVHGVIVPTGRNNGGA